MLNGIPKNPWYDVKFYDTTVFAFEYGVRLQDICFFCAPEYLKSAMASIFFQALHPVSNVAKVFHLVVGAERAGGCLTVWLQFILNNKGKPVQSIDCFLLAR